MRAAQAKSGLRSSPRTEGAIQDATHRLEVIVDNGAPHPTVSGQVVRGIVHGAVGPKARTREAADMLSTICSNRRAGNAASRVAIHGRHLVGESAAIRVLALLGNRRSIGFVAHKMAPVRECSVTVAIPIWLTASVTRHGCQRS